MEATGTATATPTETGKLPSGHPYVRIGSGKRQVLLIPGLELTAEPPRGMALKAVVGPWKPYAGEVTVLWVGRPAGLAPGTTIEDIAAQYADAIETELRPPIGVFAVSTGGAIAQALAANHPELVDRLVLAMTAHRLSPQGRQLQRRFGQLIAARSWRGAYALLGGFMFPRRRRLMSALMWLVGPRMLGTPPDVSVALVDVDAEDRHDFGTRLQDIAAPTLAMSAELDIAYPPALVAEMVELIRDARHIQYSGVGHMGPGKPLMRDAVEFLLGGAHSGGAETR